MPWWIEPSILHCEVLNAMFLRLLAFSYEPTFSS